MLVALDMLCLLLVSIPTGLSESSLLVPHIQDFFCNETTIKYTLVTHYLVEGSALITMAFFISIFMISLGEVIRIQGLQLSSPAFMSSTYMAMIYKQLSAFMFGGMTSCSQTNIAKVTTGHLRPHFLAVCLPYPASFNCESGYTTNYTCTRHPEDTLKARMYAVVYLMVNVGRRQAIHPASYFSSLFTGYMWILDYWHHPYDMVFGFLQGALMAFWVVFYISGLFTSPAMPGPSSSRC